MLVVADSQVQAWSYGVNAKVIVFWIYYLSFQLNHSIIVANCWLDRSWLWLQFSHRGHLRLIFHNTLFDAILLSTVVEQLSEFAIGFAPWWPVNAWDVGLVEWHLGGIVEFVFTENWPSHAFRIAHFALIEYAFALLNIVNIWFCDFSFLFWSCIEPILLKFVDAHYVHLVVLRRLLYPYYRDLFFTAVFVLYLSKGSILLLAICFLSLLLLRLIHIPDRFRWFVVFQFVEINHRFLSTANCVFEAELIIAKGLWFVVRMLYFGSLHDVVFLLRTLVRMLWAIGMNRMRVFIFLRVSLGNLRPA